jgi:hypothetical protein
MSSASRSSSLADSRFIGLALFASVKSNLLTQKFFTLATKVNWFLDENTYAA